MMVALMHSSQAPVRAVWEPCEGDPPRVPQRAVRGFSLARVDTRNEIRDFLTSRRAKLNAADVGLPDYGTRRVPGLRREEAAVLASVSVPSYAAPTGQMPHPPLGAASARRDDRRRRAYRQ
jgi:hypothetical protein